MEENEMTLDMAIPFDGTFAVLDKPRTGYDEGISSLRNSWVHNYPSPFDTMSLPEVGISIRENAVTVSFNTVSEISSTKWFNRTITELIRLLWLRKDWNSDNPKQISPKAVERILAVLLAILDSDSTPPIVVPTTRGGVQVEWHQKGIDLEIEAFDSGKLEYFFSGPKGEKEGSVEGSPVTLKSFTSYLKGYSTPVALNANE
jgi:hypothetical protein